jgi:hypothetical protein
VVGSSYYARYRLCDKKITVRVDYISAYMVSTCRNESQRAHNVLDHHLPQLKLYMTGQKKGPSWPLSFVKRERNTIYSSPSRRRRTSLSHVPIRAGVRQGGALARGSSAQAQTILLLFPCVFSTYRWTYVRRVRPGALLRHVPACHHPTSCSVTEPEERNRDGYRSSRAVWLSTLWPTGITMNDVSWIVIQSRSDRGQCYVGTGARPREKPR